MPAEPKDERTAAQLYRQWAVFRETKRQLVAAGVLNDDATPQDVLDAIRKLLPADSFT